MNEAARKALCGAINKWHDIVENGGEDLQAANCPLCKLFWWSWSYQDCFGCLIEAKTKRSYCRSTPYADWDNYMDEHGVPYRRVFDATSKQLAVDELLFLISLYPED